MRRAVQCYDGDGTQHETRRMLITFGFIDKRFKNPSITAQGWGCVAFWENERTALIDMLRRTLNEVVPGEPEDVTRAVAKMMGQIDDHVVNRRRGTMRVSGDGNNDVFVRVSHD